MEVLKRQLLTDKEKSCILNINIVGDAAGVLQERGVIDMSDEDLDEEDLVSITGCGIVGEA